MCKICLVRSLNVSRYYNIIDPNLICADYSSIGKVNTAELATSVSSRPASLVFVLNLET